MNTFQKEITVPAL